MKFTELELRQARRLRDIAEGRIDSLCPVNKNKHCYPLLSDPLCRQCLEEDETRKER